MKSKEARGLMEAYNAVYAPQELTEEQIWEQVENWVNSLLEEGYDLSEYTWEEMYEAYLNEKMGNIPPTTKNSPYNIRNLGASQFAAYKLGGGDAAMSQGKGTAAEIIARGRKAVKSFDGGSRISPTKPKVTPPSPPVKPTPKPVPAQKPAPMRDEPLWDSNPKPVPGPNVKPNPTAPGAPPSPASAPAPAPAPTKRFDIRDRDPRARGGFDPRFDKKPVAQMLQSKEPYQPAKPPVSVQRATPATPAAAPAPAPAPKPSALAQRVAGYKAGGPVMGARERMLNQSFDLFDVIKGHLLDEGYADNEDAALAIMANMSEEWKQSIVEGGINFSVPSRIDDFNNRRDELKNRYKQDVGPRIPGPGGGGQYGEPPAPKATGVRLAKGTSSSNRGTETKNNA